MSEYVRKQPLLEILKQESGSPNRMYDTKQGIKWAIEQIQSGAFDAHEMEHINAYWAREGLIKHQQEEIQRLRAALVEIKQLLNENRENDGAFQNWNHMQAWKVATQALSTTTEPTGAELVRECPECGAPLIENRWCSRLICKYGYNNPHGINAMEGDGNDA